MFLASALAYPLVTALLCLGAGLAVDRVGGGFAPGPLLPVLGLAALVGLAQLTTYLYPLAPATPYVLAGAGAGGLALGRARLRAVDWRAQRGALLGAVAVFAVALAPVLLAGRATFSAYMVLTDSALHMVGADYLIRHGQHYAHLDLVNSYGQYIQSYYGTGYPTGADALLGGTAFLLRVPVIWAFQPFNALALALAYGPALALARRAGLAGGWAVAAAVAASVPALPYAYELIGSIKEVVALPLILALGALVCAHRGWLRGPPRAAVPFAVTAAAGVSVLGAAFGAWAAGAVLVLAGILAAAGGVREQAARAARLVGVGALTALVCAWPTWLHTSSALRIAQTIAVSSNRGNLVHPLRAEQVFGPWLYGSYQGLPVGVGLPVTDILVAVSALAALGGLLRLARTRRVALASWLGMMVALAVVVTRVGGTWSDAKTLMLSSPVVVLAAWSSLPGLLRERRRLPAAALALVLLGGVLASDFLQYRDTQLAPTSRYDELAAIGGRFAGRGPTLFTDFDEYALYELARMDVGGPDFLYPPRGLGIDVGHGNAVYLNDARPGALRRYPLIVTRRDPLVPRPPSAYALVWQGTYYQVWRRRRGAPLPLARVRLTGRRVVPCAGVAAIAGVARTHGAVLVTAAAADAVEVSLRRARRPAAWTRDGPWYVLAAPGRLRATLRIPRGGRWDLWLQGEFMPNVVVWVDGRAVASVGGQVGGDAVVPDTTAPVRLRLAAGRHRIALSLSGGGLGPGAGAGADLTAITLTPASREAQPLRVWSARRWHALCGHRYTSIEALPVRLVHRVARRRRARGPDGRPSARPAGRAAQVPIRQ